MKKQLLSIAVSTSLLFAACGENGTKSGETGDVSTETSSSSGFSLGADTKETGSFLTNEKALAAAQSKLIAMKGLDGKDVQVFQNIHFYEDGRIKLAIQDPEKPENIDDYLFQDGEWLAPQPVQISGGGDMEANVFPLSRLKFETVAAIYKQLETEAKEVEGAKIDGHIFYNLNVMKQSGQWIGSVQGARGSYQGFFEADGTLKDFKKN